MLVADQKLPIRSDDRPTPSDSLEAGRPAEGETSARGLLIGRKTTWQSTRWFSHRGRLLSAYEPTTNVHTHQLPRASRAVVSYQLAPRTEAISDVLKPSGREPSPFGDFRRASNMSDPRSLKYSARTQQPFVRSASCYRREKREVSKIVQPEADQFEVEGNVVTHIPTNAKWTAYDGAQTPHLFSRGALGRILPNGDEYYPEEVAVFALKMLAGRVKRLDD
jgi:hypothetical protein